LLFFFLFLFAVDDPLFSVAYGGRVVKKEQLGDRVTYIQCSAKTGAGVNQLFQTLAARLYVLH
jgi:hypothetical protein